MRILVIGSGGREHALVWKLSQSPFVDEIYCAPGNAGIAEMASCVAIDPSEIIELADFAQELKIGFTIVGPELPLTMGVVDEFLKRGLRIFGPRKLAAELEGSKVFAKEFMKAHDIPTGHFEIFASAEEARKALSHWTCPMVVKADGLAAGKGVIVCKTKNEAQTAVQTLMVDKKFSMAGERVVFEEFLEGTEVSFIAVCDGKRALPLVTSQDHKQLLDGGEGPNTGGMGAFSPARNVNAEDFKAIMERALVPTLRGLEKEGRRYIGFLYVGLMMTAEGPKVLEYNCRLGDPEAQVILPRLKSDLLLLLQAAAEKNVARARVKWDSRAAVCVVLAAEGYPSAPKKGMPISGLDTAGALENVSVFHAGTAKKDGRVAVGGGRVLGVMGQGEKLSLAVRRAYEGVGKIHFDGMQFRRDVGISTLKQYGDA